MLKILERTFIKKKSIPFGNLSVSSKRLYFERVHAPERMEIRLTPSEDQLCNLLDECTRHMKDTEGIETSCRIAGGWVRDKARYVQQVNGCPLMYKCWALQLLGSQSNDIDIALTDMMGVHFAERFLSFCSSVKCIQTGTIAKVESNPDQSKHLETAKTKLLDLELDFVNLRSEEYAEHSRIPTQVVNAKSHCTEAYHANLPCIDVWYTATRRFTPRHHHQCSLLQRALKICGGSYRKGIDFISRRIIHSC